MGTGKFTADPGKSINTPDLFNSSYWNRDKLWPDGPLGLYADFTLLTNVETLRSLIIFNFA